jgi:ATP phosphoribosyltransferase regulatory subunit
MQVGLECIGDVDDYCISEVLTLAARSLLEISPRCVLDISHLGILSAVMDALSVPADARAALLASISEKNLHELSAKAAAAGVSESGTALLCELSATYGKPRDVLPRLTALLKDVIPEEMLCDFRRILSALEAAGLGDVCRVDSSVVGDMSYYNGIVFKGFVEGVPTGVLSGGQYDRLMKKMGRTAAAIGFAVYLDLLERLNENARSVDADAVVLYDEQADVAALSLALKALTDEGKTVLTLKTVPEKLRYGKLYQFDGREGTLREIHAECGPA